MDPLGVRPVDRDDTPSIPPRAGDVARLEGDLAEVAAATGLELDAGRDPDDDGLVYCCASLGRVTPAEAYDHVEDTLRAMVPGY